MIEQNPPIQTREATAMARNTATRVTADFTGYRGDARLYGYRGDVRLYRLDPPLEGHEYVIVSAARAPFSGPQTYIFPADSSGDVVDWGALPGSFQGGLDHEAALEGAGYTVTTESADRS